MRAEQSQRMVALKHTEAALHLEIVAKLFALIGVLSFSVQ